MSTIPNPPRGDAEITLGPWLERAQSDDEGPDAAEPAALDHGSSGLVEWRSLTGVVRRGMRIWVATALVGLLAGAAMFVRSPASTEATTSVILVYGPYENITTAPGDSLALVQSRAVAERALHDLHLTMTVDGFLSTYSVQPVSNRVLSLRVVAPTSAAAVDRANALAVAFLDFRALQLRQSEALVQASLDSQISTAKAELATIDGQIGRASAGTARGTGESQASALQDERARWSSIVNSLEQSASAGQARSATDLAVRGSQVLDSAAASTPSHLRRLVLFLGAGLIVGLALGVGGVVIRGVVTDRLRRRDDIAQALGIPVRLSVGRIRFPRRVQPVRRHQRSRLNYVRRVGARFRGQADIDRLVAHLGGAARVDDAGLLSLAVVPADDPHLAAASIASLALACAQDGKRVVVADLVPGVPTARLLKVPGPGVHPVIVNGAALVVTVPADEDLLPAGPLQGGSSWVQRSGFTDDVGAVCGTAEVLLTLMAVEPSLGADHLATWAGSAVVVVTAGRSSSTRLNSLGELLLSTDVQTLSAVLVGGDKSDESLGVPLRAVSSGSRSNWHAE